MAKKNMVEVSVASERAEAIGGVLIAFFAALMAVAELVNSELEEEMMIAHNKHTSYSSWYQSKSIKQSLKESEIDYLETLLLMEVDLDSTRLAVINDKIKTTRTAVEKYNAEKNEILVGSSSLSEKEWVQDLDGEMGMIVGVKEWEQLANDYDVATKKFDIGMLFFQISIVLGAVCIIIYDNPKLQKSFIGLMIAFGIIGILLSIYGYVLAP